MQRITKAWARRRKAAGLRKVLRCGMASWKIIGERSVLMRASGLLNTSIFAKPAKRREALFVGKSATSKLTNGDRLRVFEGPVPVPQGRLRG